MQAIRLCQRTVLGEEERVGSHAAVDGESNSGQPGSQGWENYSLSSSGSEYSW